MGKKNVLIAVLAILVFSVSMIGCNDKKAVEEFNATLDGEHSLRRFKVTDEKYSRWGARYFLFFGSASGGEYHITRISFSWQTKSGGYIISEAPIRQIRIIINDSVKTPFVTFSKIDYCDICRNSMAHENDMLRYLFRQDGVVTIYCKEEDFPADVNLKNL